MKKQIPIKLFTAVLCILSVCIPDLQGQVPSDTALVTTHYVLPDFVLGSVKLKNGRTEAAVMNYNKLTEEMIFDKDGVKLALDSLVAIDTVNIDSRLFVPHEKFFYEVLVIGKVALFKEHKCNIIPAGNPSGYGGTSETGASRSLSSLTSTGRAYKLKLPRDYHVTDASRYWIRIDNIYYKANTGGQIAKIFPGKEKQIKQYIKEKKLDLYNPTDLVTLVVQCNGLVN
jgi:hypothetical protein